MLTRRVCLAAIIVNSWCASVAFASLRVGAGFSTVTSGRQIPALELGLDFGTNWTGTTMLAGARTETYYTSGIMVNVLRNKNWGKFLFGTLEVGFGLGGFYGEKGVFNSRDENLKKTDFIEDRDNTFGPAFRVAFKPFSGLHFSLEYLMGIGASLFSNAWEDVGMGSIGVDL